MLTILEYVVIWYTWYYYYYGIYSNMVVTAKAVPMFVKWCYKQIQSDHDQKEILFCI